MKRVLVVTAAVVGLAVTLGATRPANPPESSDCEAIHSGWVRQPANALSAVVIVVAGALILSRAGSGHQARFGASVLAVGMASSLSHATSHPVAATLDFIGTAVAIAAAFVLIGIERPPWRRLIAPAAVVIIGYLVWALSRTGELWCDPEAVVGGHAVWHLAVALGVVALHRGVVRSRDTSPDA